MNREFEVLESQSSFDFKAFLFRALSYWKLFIVFIAIGVFMAYQVNIRKQRRYKLSTQISIEDDKNPLFTSNTSLTFNWGGVTGKVQTMMVSLKSRSHNEKVVERLQFYKRYLKQGPFRKEDIYKLAPFRIFTQSHENQLLGHPIRVEFLNHDTYKIEIEFLLNTAKVQNFKTKEKSIVDVDIGTYTKKFKLGDSIKLPFLNGVLDIAPKRKIKPGAVYYLQFDNFDSVVNRYKSIIGISNQKNSPILNLSLVDVNKSKIVDYLNETVTVLSEEQLDRKNQFATNTIKFIENQLKDVKDRLKDNASELNSYRKKNKIFNLDEESVKLSEKLAGYDLEKESVKRQLDYYDNLKNYLKESKSFTDIPAPSIAGIDDTNILSNVSKINELSVRKSKLEYSVRSDATIFDDLNRQIEGLKAVLLENINAAKNVLARQYESVNSKLNKAESLFSKLPEDQQRMLTFERQYNLTEQTYTVFLQKQSEAEIIKASSVSDILVIDSAKDIGQRAISSNNSTNYFLAFFMGVMIPLLFAFLMTLIDNNIHGPEDLEQLSSIPVLGVIGKNTAKNNLVVHLKPKSAVSEAFRAIRSSLQYLYKKHELKGSKTVMITSSVSGEGKTFCSINIATVFALSDKKTVLVGLDLRKPKIFGDFEITNEKGAVNYLIGQSGLEEIIQKTEIKNLDLIVSGPIPPNPSELLISEKMDAFIEALKQEYDYIVLDTPPVGLVSDAMELIEYADASLYVVRQDYTKKAMLNLINDKYKRGEINSLSFVYNHYNQKGTYNYGYGYSYGYGAYGNGYHEDDQAKKTLFKRLTGFIKK